MRSVDVTSRLVTSSLTGTVDRPARARACTALGGSVFAPYRTDSEKNFVVCVIPGASGPPVVAESIKVMLGRGSAMKAKAGKPASREHPVTAKRASLVDIEWVAERLGVSVRYVRRLVDEKAIPFVKVRHLLRFEPTEIEAWIDGRRRPVANEHG